MKHLNQATKTDNEVFLEELYTTHDRSDFIASSGGRIY